MLVLECPRKWNTNSVGRAEVPGGIKSLNLLVIVK